MNHDNSETRIKLPVESQSIKKSAFYIFMFFLTFSFILLWAYANFPNFEPDELERLKLPRNIEDAKDIGRLLSRYKDKYSVEVLLGIFFIYIFLQTFAVPGSIFLSILMGYLFPWYVALLLICFCSATGASLCYCLSYMVGKPLIRRYFPRKIDEWQMKVDRHRDNLLFYVIFLRITPFLPNWFINIASPVINVPLKPFWLGTFIGVGPPSVLAVQAGTTLYQLTSSTDSLSMNSILILTVSAILSLVPVILKNRLRSKFE